MVSASRHRTTHRIGSMLVCGRSGPSHYHRAALSSMRAFSRDVSRSCPCSRDVCGCDYHTAIRHSGEAQSIPKFGYDWVGPSGFVLHRNDRLHNIVSITAEVNVIPLMTFIYRNSLELSKTAIWSRSGTWDRFGDRLTAEKTNIKGANCHWRGIKNVSFFVN